jgi:uncharacterized protein involved in response to NO
MLISLVGGRIIPSFTHNWLAKFRSDAGPLAPQRSFDLVVLVGTAVALAIWVAVPDTAATSWILTAAGIAVALLLSRWRGLHTAREPQGSGLNQRHRWPIGASEARIGVVDA